MSEMGQEQIRSLERQGAEGGIELPAIEPGELGPAEPESESGPQATEAGPSWAGDSAAGDSAAGDPAATDLAEAGAERLAAGLERDDLEPGEAGPAEAGPEELPGGLSDLGQAPGSVERSVSSDLGQASGDAAGAAESAGAAERIAAGDAGAAMHAAGVAGEGIADRAGQMAESILPGGDAGPGHPAEQPGPRVEPGLAHDDTEAKPAPGADAPGHQQGLRLDTPQAPEPAPRSQPR
ncbi:MAG TPA: hypothetical protein VMU95_31150 [Trebonia sp.]|nr:hypothetical protein [Trebonia sp.]